MLNCIAIIPARGGVKGFHEKMYLIYVENL